MSYNNDWRDKAVSGGYGVSNDDCLTNQLCEQAACDAYGPNSQINKNRQYLNVDPLNYAEHLPILVIEMAVCLSSEQKMLKRNVCTDQSDPPNVLAESGRSEKMEKFAMAMELLRERLGLLLSEKRTPIGESAESPIA